MNKIDRRKNYYIVLDTETANSNFDGKVTPDSALVYDCGFAVIDKTGKVYEQYSFINEDIFFKMEEQMQSAYYADKIPLYLSDIEDGIREVANYYTIRHTLEEVARKYDVKAIIAHNARFDYKAATATQRYLTKSKYRYFFPYGVEIWDSLKMAHDTICKQKNFIRFCQDNGFMTKHKTPRPRETAEVIYRYITNNPEFIEQHTGLEDVYIEKEIVAKCFAQHKPMRTKLFND